MKRPLVILRAILYVAIDSWDTLIDRISREIEEIEANAND